MRSLVRHSLLCLLLSLLSLAGCGDSNDPKQPAAGEVRIYLVDRPAAYDEVNIVVREVSVHRADADSVSGWIVIDDDVRTFDLLALANGAMEVLGEGPLDPGHYTQIRLKLGEGSTVVVDGESHPLEVPSGMQSGVKLNHPFDILDGTLYELTLDFDAARSIHVTGNDRYILSPVIRVVANAVTGSISGTISPALSQARVWTSVGADTASAFADGVSGAFKLVGLPPDTYSVHIEPDLAAYRDTTLTGIAVAAGQNSDLGTVLLRP